MSALDLDLSAPLRTAVIGSGDVVALLGGYAGEPSVHTRRPAPSEAGYPMVIISADITLTDGDALTGSRPMLQRDITAYGIKGAPGDTSDQTRDVEAIGYLLRELFHRNRFAITVPNYGVVSIVASGPIEAPTEDEKLVGRMVSLAIQLQRRG